MPGISTPAGVASALSQSVDEVYTYLLHLAYRRVGDQISTNLYYANAYVDVTYMGRTYVAKSFQFILPSESSERPPTTRLSIEDVDRALISRLRDVEFPPDMNVFIVRVDDMGMGTLEGSLTGLIMKNLSRSADEDMLTCDVLWDAFVSEPYPVHRYDPNLFPGLFR